MTTNREKGERREALQYRLDTDTDQWIVETHEANPYSVGDRVIVGNTIIDVGLDSMSVSRVLAAVGLVLALDSLELEDRVVRNILGALNWIDDEDHGLGLRQRPDLLEGD